MSGTTPNQVTINGSTSGWDPTVQDEIVLALSQNGGLKRIQATLKQRLDEAGWSQELREYCTRLFRSGEAGTYDEALGMIMKRVQGEGEGEVGKLEIPREAQEGGAEAVRKELAQVVRS